MPKTVKLFEVEEVEEFLIDNNIPVTTTYHTTEDVDGCVTINDILSIQVCEHGGLILNEWVDNRTAIQPHGLRMELSELLEDIRKVFK